MVYPTNAKRGAAGGDCKSIVSLSDLVARLQQDMDVAQQEIVFDDCAGFDDDDDDDDMYHRPDKDDDDDDDTSDLSQEEDDDDNDDPNEETFFTDPTFVQLATGILTLLEQRHLHSARWKWQPAVREPYAGTTCTTTTMCHGWLLENRWWMAAAAAAKKASCQSVLASSSSFSSSFLSLSKTSGWNRTSTSTTTPPRFVLLVFPREAQLNVTALEQAIRSNWKLPVSSNNNNNNNRNNKKKEHSGDATNFVPMAWQLASMADRQRLFGHAMTGDTSETDKWGDDICPLVSVLSRPHQAARVPVLCCRSVSSYLWMPVHHNRAATTKAQDDDDDDDDNDGDNDNHARNGTTLLGMSIRDMMQAVQPYLVANLSKKLPSGAKRDAAHKASLAAVQRTAEIPSMPKKKKHKKKSLPSKRVVTRRPRVSTTKHASLATAAAASNTRPLAALSSKTSQNQSIAAQPSMIKSSPTGGSLQSVATTASTTPSVNSSTRVAPPVMSRRIMCRNDISVTPKATIVAGGTANSVSPVGRSIRRPSAHTRRGGRRSSTSYHTSEHTEESSTIFDTALDTDDDEDDDDDDSDDDYAEKNKSGLKSTNGNSTDDNLMLDGLLSDDDDLAMLNELASTADTDTDDLEFDFEETATTGDLEDALLEDENDGPITERVDSHNRVTRIHHTKDFVRQAPSRTISVEEHPDLDPECITEAKAPVAMVRNRSLPRASRQPRRRRRVKLRGGNGKDIIRRAPTRSMSTSEHPEFEMEGIISEVKSPMAKPTPSTADADKKFTRRTPSRAISMSEHPDFDTEECITETKPLAAKSKTTNFSRKTPSRAISMSEHPDFDMEECITEAKPAATQRQSNFTRKTPSRAISSSEHPDFDVEQCITEAKPSNGNKDRRSTRRAPSRAISMSEHPDFDMEETIMEATITEMKDTDDPRSNGRMFSRQTPSRAISTSEHPDFDLEDCITEVKPMNGQTTYMRMAPARTISTESYDPEPLDESCLPAGLSADIAQQIQLDLQQDRKEQALVEAALASESAVNRNMLLQENMPTSGDLENSDADEYLDDTYESEDDVSEEEETIDVSGEDFTGTDFPSETDITETNRSSSL